MKPSIDPLADRTANIVMSAAVEYLHAHGLTVAPETLAFACRTHARIRLPEALHDAKEALACHMDSVAGLTFAATMRLAGIDAAKAVSHPSNP